MGEGRPWGSTLQDGAVEDSQEQYMTTWEPSTKAFKSQMCSVKRTIGGKDIGRFKLQQFKNYEVDVGMKVFYSKASSLL